jgi:hypothetical protein
MYDILVGVVCYVLDGTRRMDCCAAAVNVTRRAQPPFVGNNRKATMEKIMQAKLRMPPYLSENARDILRKVSH